MFRQARDCRRSLPQNRFTRILQATLVSALFCAASLEAQTVVTYDFEDGTAGGWTSFNGATTPVASSAACLATSRRAHR